MENTAPDSSARFVIINKTTEITPEIKSYIEQAGRLQNEQFSRHYGSSAGAPPSKQVLNDIKSGNETYTVLVDRDDKVIAAAHIQAGDIVTQEECNDLRLPYDLRTKKVGRLTGVAGGANDDVMTPGMVLQSRILSAFKSGQLGLDILVGVTMPLNVAPVFMAVQKSDLKLVVRHEPRFDMAPGGEKIYFMAIANDPSLNLVPEDRQRNVLSDEQVRDIGKGILKSWRKNASQHHDKEGGRF